jgi:hypothetical protein
MRVSFAASVAKYQQDSRLNEDAFGERASHGVYAVSDGASESFDSRVWSKLLVQLFLRNPHVNERWLRRAVTVYAGLFDREAMSWSAQAAFDRGSFATLTGIVIPPTRSPLQGLGSATQWPFLPTENKSSVLIPTSGPSNLPRDR